MLGEKKPDFRKEFKRQIEDKENMFTGYENKSDVELLQELNDLRDLINKTKDPLGESNTAGIGNLADLETLQNQMKDLEMEIHRRTLLN